MNLKNKLHIFLISLLLIIPINCFAYSNYVIPGGETIGIEVNSKGVLVVGFYKVNNKNIAKEAGFQIGDIITKVNNNEITNINSMVKEVNKSINSVKFNILRNNKEKEINLNLEKDQNNILKTGLYVKDKINGIGTLTYIDPESRVFGALGHEIIENTTISKFEIKDGIIYEANVSNIIKSRNGKAGEKNANYDKTKIWGTIKENEMPGIFGTYSNRLDDLEKLKVAELDEITSGEAIIRTVISGTEKKDFKINIIHIDRDSKNKNILFEVTDKELLEKTGGIVQGMSGSPIIQDGKIVGAVTHVLVDSVKKGYGLYIDFMIEASQMGC